MVHINLIKTLATMVDFAAVGVVEKISFEAMVKVDFRIAITIKTLRRVKAFDLFSFSYLPQMDFCDAYQICNRHGHYAHQCFQCHNHAFLANAIADTASIHSDMHSASTTSWCLDSGASHYMMPSANQLVFS